MPHRSKMSSSASNIYEKMNSNLGNTRDRGDRGAKKLITP